VKLIHVGLGGWGGDWERNAIPPVKDVDRVAIVDPHEPTLRRVQEEMKVPDERTFASLTDALANVEADGVIVTAPMFAHVPLALEALEAGKHVLVEKPFAGNVAEAKTAVDRAEELGLIVQVSQNYRFYPAPRAVEQLIRDDAIGVPSVINVDFRRWANDAEKDGHRHYHIQHPLIFDMAIHHFDLIRKITGEDAVKVYAKASDPAWSKFTEEGSAVVTIELQSGLVVSYRGSWISRGQETHWDGDWHIQGETGEIFFTGRSGGSRGPADDVVTLRRAGEEPEDVALESMDLWGRSYGLREFARAIRGEVTPETLGRNNLGSVALMEAAAKSTLSGQVEDVIIP